MKILQLVQKPQRRGAEVFAFQLTGELRRQGHEVCLTYLYPHQGKARLPQGEGDVVLSGREDQPIERVLGFHPRLSSHVQAVIKSFRPDAVQVNGSRSVKYGALAGRLERKRQWVLVYRNIGQPKDWVHGWRRRMFYRYLVMPQIDGVVGVSQMTLQAAAHFHRLNVPAIHIPRAVSPEALVAGRAAAEMRREIGTPPKAPVLVSVGSLTPEKRMDRMLRVMQQVIDRMPNVYLWLVGDGPLRRELELQAEEHGVAGQVHFVGIQADVASYLNAADLFVLTSDTEGIPGVVLEAGFLGLPVVATRVGGLPECVIEGETGLLVEPEDEAALARAVVDLLQDLARRQAMGQRAQGWVRSRFTMERIAGQYLEFYSEVLDARWAAA
jgi:glycosyltransferase involved in cell wall biosynthesis